MKREIKIAATLLIIITFIALSGDIVRLTDSIPSQSPMNTPSLLFSSTPSGYAAEPGDQQTEAASEIVSNENNTSPITPVPAPPVESSVKPTENPPRTFTLSIINSDPDAGTVSGSGQYSEGSYAVVNARPAKHYKFVKWTGGVSNSKSAETKVLMAKDTTISAVFSINQYKLEVTESGDGVGTISKYEPYYDALKEIKLTASPDSTSVFIGWFIGDTKISSEPTCKLALEGDTLVEAKFDSIYKGVDVTTKVQVIGNPFTKRTYARNVWDMQVYHGFIYLGHGNSSNYEPVSNAGPVDVIKYDPATDKFITEYTVNEEQIDIYRIIDGKLYIPGHDPRDDWSFGNYYFLDDKWYKVRTVPKAVHMYDITGFNGKLYVATGTDSLSEVLKSGDNGETWEPVQAEGEQFFTLDWRAYSLFEFKNKLYAAGMFIRTNDYSSKILCTDGTDVTLLKIDTAKMFPELNKDTVMKLVRPTVVNNTLLYIAGMVSNDHQYIPLAFYKTDEIGVGTRIRFNGSDAIPYDVLVRGSAVYVLASVKNSDNSFTNVVYFSNDLKTWNKVLSFTSDAFARSFEELDGDFYFGLGCDTKVMPDSTGNILRVLKEDYQ